MIETKYELYFAKHLFFVLIISCSTNYFKQAYLDWYW